MTNETVHATTIAIGRAGVMITGPSGSGKSDLAIRLIDRGAVLVSDDRTRLVARDGVAYGAPPPTIAGRIEVRGVGIVALPFVEDVPIAMLVRLGREDERLPEPASVHVAGCPVRVLELDPFTAAAPIKVELALAQRRREHGDA